MRTTRSFTDDVQASPFVDEAWSSALASLYEEERDRLVSMLMRRGMSAVGAADVVQDAFLRLLRIQGDEIRDLRGYLFRTAENLAMDVHRRDARAGRVIDPSAELDEVAADPAPLPDDRLMSSQELAALQAALAELSPRCREVLLLHRIEGLSYAEIAERLGIARNTVMVHMVKALSELRRRVADAAGAAA